MTKASINLQELRRKIYRKAKTEKHWRFWGLYCHICKKEVLEEAYRLAKANDGAPGVDGKSFDDIEAEGVEGFLEGIRQELLERSYRALPNRRVEIPKGNGKTRTLGIQTAKDHPKEDGLIQKVQKRLNKNREGKTYVSKTPRKKKQQEIGKRVKSVLKANWNKPLKEVIQAVNSVIRGWVNYFRIGNSNSTFNKVRDYIERKVRKFVMRRKKLKGFGWKKWSREDIYEKWGLYNDYQIRYIRPKATPSR